jgi:Mlc titration factor MtfA (ptsG expression regulator)
VSSTGSSGVWARLSALAAYAQRLVAPEASRRRELRAKPLPRPTQELLTRHSAHYRSLPPDTREEFNRQVQVFLTDKQITPVETRLTAEARLLVAASAVTLTAGWPGYTWDQLRDVLVYPDHFDRDYQFASTRSPDGEPAPELAPDPIMTGQAHPWGVVILSRPALQASFAATGRRGGHVGLHEFAHLLDLSRATFDGVPSYLRDEGVRQWTRIMEHEHERLEHGDSVLDPYGLSSPPELFAVAVEAFFQDPVAVATRHRDLYAFLTSYFNQDPAAWIGRRQSAGSGQ